MRSARDSKCNRGRSTGSPTAGARHLTAAGHPRNAGRAVPAARVEGRKARVRAMARVVPAGHRGRANRPRASRG